MVHICTFPSNDICTLLRSNYITNRTVGLQKVKLNLKMFDKSRKQLHTVLLINVIYRT